jgi:hypothetical protein
MSKHIAIEDFGKNMAGQSTVHYGLDQKRIIATLRRFADLLECGSIGLCTIDLAGVCRADEFTTNTLTIQFFDQAPPP